MRHIGTCVFCFALAAFPAHGTAILFRPGEPVVELGTGTAVAINNHNQVVINTGNHTFVYIPNRRPVDIGSLGGGRTWGTAINDQGMVVGFSYTAEGIQHAFVWTPDGGMLDLGVHGTVSDINNSGVAVGYQWTPDGRTSSFFWSQATGLSPVSSPYLSTLLFGINDSGQATGSGGGSAFVYSPSGGFNTLDLSPWVFRRPIAISESGVVVGYVSENPGNQRALIWSPATGVIILPPGFYEATAVNDSAGVVGSVYTGGGFLRTPDGSTYTFPNFRPNGINDAGYLVGYMGGLFDTPEPGTLGLLTLSACGLAVWHCRRNQA